MKLKIRIKKHITASHNSVFRDPASFRKYSCQEQPKGDERTCRKVANPRILEPDIRYGVLSMAEKQLEARLQKLQ